MTENENKAPATEAQQELAQASEGKAEASVELSEDDLEAVAGGLVTSSPPSDEFR